MDKGKVIATVAWLKQAIAQYQGVIAGSNFASDGHRITVLNSEDSAKNFKVMQDHLDLIMSEVIK